MGKMEKITLENGDVLFSKEVLHNCVSGKHCFPHVITPPHDMISIKGPPMSSLETIFGCEKKKNWGKQK